MAWKASQEELKAVGLTASVVREREKRETERQRMRMHGLSWLPPCKAESPTLGWVFPLPLWKPPHRGVSASNQADNGD